MLLLDLLAAAHGYVKDAAITGQLGVSGKVANRALRYLQSEGLLQSGACRPLAVPPGCLIGGAAAAYLGNAGAYVCVPMSEGHRTRQAAAKKTAAVSLQHPPAALHRIG